MALELAWSVYFEEMKNLLIHNCIGSHTNCFMWSVYCTMCPVLGCPNPQQTLRTWRYSVRTRGKSEEVLKLKVSVFSYYYHAETDH